MKTVRGNPLCKADASGSILKEPVGIMTVDGSCGGDG